MLDFSPPEREELTMRRGDNRDTRRGAAMVEMALVLPLFILLAFSIVEFGRAMMASQLVTNAARDGARLAAIDGSTNQQVRDAVLEFLELSLGPNSSSASITIEVNGAASEVANCSPGDMCTITVSIPYSEITLTRAQFLDSTNIVGHCAMRREW